jgi:hypothetical protein
MVEYYEIEIYVLLIMAIIMFITCVGVLFLAHKKGTPNMILWALFIFSWGLHWLSEAIADYYEEVLENEMFIHSQMELVTAFISSFILLAACLEYNGMLRRHMGKIIALISSILPIYFILTLNEKTLEDIEDQYIIRGDIISTEVPRFLYGFILPLIAIIALLCTFLYYYYQTRKGKIFYNPKVLKINIILAVFIFVFSLFNGFDYFEEDELEIVFISLRAITLSFFIILPLIIIFTYDLGLQKFLIIEHSGIPLFAYSFETKSATKDDISFLTSGFLSALIGFSEGITERESDTLSIHSNYLYYIITKKEKKIYALQSISKNKPLVKLFFQVSNEIDKSLANVKEANDVDINQLKEIIDINFSAFY